MPDYQYDIKLGYSPRDGKWILDDGRQWVEVEEIDDMINYLKSTVKLRMEGEILVRRHGDKWYMRDASKYQMFNNPEEMSATFKEIANNFQDEVIQPGESLFGRKKGKRGIDMTKVQTWVKDVNVKTEVEVKETKQFCAWHREAEKVATCTGCEKSLCDKCIGKQIEENVFCHSCWTQYKYSSRLEKFKKQREG
jgi:hypothetical protein